MPGMALQSDFTAGELSHSLLARVDFEKYSKGCRTLKNFFVKPHGGAVKRPGLLLFDALPGPAHLIEFQFSTTQSYALIFGEKWVRFATHDGMILDDSGNVYEIESPLTLEQAKSMSYTQSADVVYIAHRDIAPQKLMRYGHSNWKFEAISFAAPLPAPSIVGGGAVISGGTSIPIPYRYYVTAINSDGKEGEVSSEAFVMGQSSNNWIAGSYIHFTWNLVSGAQEYRVYRSAWGGNIGYVSTVSTSGTFGEWKDTNVTATMTETAPKFLHPFVLTDDAGKTVYDYPGAVSLFQQRLVFASSMKRPQTVWMSKSGDYENFASYSPLADDSPMEMTIASREVSPVNWMVPLRSMIIGTSSMEWEISGGDSAFSSTNKQATAQSYWGSALNSAMIIGNIVLHVASSGRQVRNLQYDYASDSYGGIDLSILAGHLFEKASVVDWTYQKHPDSVVWCVMSDGGLLGLTFQSEHQIAAWHRHETQGSFLSVTSMQYGFDYDLFAVVQRGDAYYLERMAEQHYSGEVARNVYVDCALTYDEEEEVEEITGLDHLEGLEVGIFSNGAVEQAKVVTDGKIQLDIPSKIVTIGLLYTADLETMPVEVTGQEGPSVALKKTINTINVSFHESLGVKAGLNENIGDIEKVRWEDIKWRTNEPYGVAPKPFSGIKHLTMNKAGANQVSICIRSRNPTPVTVQAIMSRIQVNAQ